MRGSWLSDARPCVASLGGSVILLAEFVSDLGDKTGVSKLFGHTCSTASPLGDREAGLRSAGSGGLLDRVGDGRYGVTVGVWTMLGLA